MKVNFFESVYIRFLYLSFYYSKTYMYVITFINREHLYIYAQIFAFQMRIYTLLEAKGLTRANSFQRSYYLKCRISRFRRFEEPISSIKGLCNIKLLVNDSLSAALFFQLNSIIVTCNITHEDWMFLWRGITYKHCRILEIIIQDFTL